MGGEWDSTNVADGAGRGLHADRARPRSATSGDTLLEIARTRRGSSRPARRSSWPRSSEDVEGVVLAAAAERGRPRGARGRRHRGGRAAGGRRRAADHAAGARRHLHGDLPAAARRVPGAQRAASPSTAVGGAPHGRRGARPRRRRGRVRRRRLARAGSRWCAPARRSSSTARTTRRASRRSSTRSRRLSSSTGSSASSA